MSNRNGRYREYDIPNNRVDTVGTRSSFSDGTPIRRQIARPEAPYEVESLGPLSPAERTYRATAYQDYSDIYQNSGYRLQFYSFIYEEKVHFKAWMDGFTDSFTTNWNSEVVFGRPDPYRIYQNTERSLSIKFKIIAGSIEEAKENLKKMNILAKMNYPTYSKGKGNANAATIRGAPLMKFKFVNLITSAKSNDAFGDAREDGLIGVLDGVTFDFKLDEGVLIEKNREGDPSNGSIYPKHVEVSFNFHVLHDHFVGLYKQEWQGPNEFPYGVSGAGNNPKFYPVIEPATLPSINGIRPRGDSADTDPDISSRGEIDFRATDDGTRTQSDIQSEDNARPSTAPYQIIKAYNDLINGTFNARNPDPTQVAK